MHFRCLAIRINSFADLNQANLLSAFAELYSALAHQYAATATPVLAMPVLLIPYPCFAGAKLCVAFAIANQFLALPPQFQADRTYAIAFLCYATALRS